MKRGLLFAAATACFAQAALPAEQALADASEQAFAKQMDGYLKKDENLQKIIASLTEFDRRRQTDEMKKREQAEEEAIEGAFKNPKTIDIGSSPIKGPADAKVTVFEFSDFQCPYCKQGHDVMEELAKAYPNDVKLVFKHFPLDEIHPHARPASRAAWAAGKQGKFFEMSSLLFNSQREIAAQAKEGFVAFAEKLGLDKEQFLKDYNSPESNAAVDADMKLAAELGVNGTPGFFVNGVPVQGARPIEYFKGLVDRWLKAKK